METKNIDIYRGDTLQFELIIPDYNDNPMDVTGFSYLSQIRPAKESVQILGSFEVSDIDPTVGKVLLTLPAIASEAMYGDFPVDGVAYWDVEVISTDATPIITTPFGGTVSFTEDVSRF